MLICQRHTQRMMPSSIPLALTNRSAFTRLTCADIWNLHKIAPVRALRVIVMSRGFGFLFPSISEAGRRAYLDSSILNNVPRDRKTPDYFGSSTASRLFRLGHNQ
jgi:hypothetical protein